MKNYLPTFAAAWHSVKAFLTTRGTVQNRFDAAIQTFGNQRWLWSSYQDARFDVNTATSMEICRKHLDLISNTPLLQKIRNLFIQFSVGFDGLMVVPNASDPHMDKAACEAWNEARAAQFEMWSRSPELGSNLTLQELTIQWEGMLFDVGNVIVQKTRDELGRPKIQTIDRLRLATPPQFASEEGKTILDGIRLKKISVPCRVVADGVVKTINREVVTGKPASYFIRDEFDLNLFQEIPADQIIHKYRATRPGQMIGIPKGTAAITTAIDYTDLHILEMTAQKEAAQPSVVETNATGELNTLAARRVPLQVQTTNADGASVTKAAPGFYNVVRGLSKYALKHGDKLENFQVKRPDPCQQEYWRLKRSEICICYGVSPILVMPDGVQGTQIRLEMDVSTGNFRSDFEIIEDLLRDIYQWQTEWDVKYGKGMDGQKPSNYLACTIRPPEGPDVDVGYTPEALAKERELGKVTFQEMCAADNRDWRNVLRENAELETFKESLCVQFKIAPENREKFKSSIEFHQFASAAIQVQADQIEAQSNSTKQPEKTEA